MKVPEIVLLRQNVNDTRSNFFWLIFIKCLLCWQAFYSNWCTGVIVYWSEESLIWIICTNLQDICLKCVFLCFSSYDFHDLFVDAPATIARIAKEMGVERLIHFSHLNADPNPPDLIYFGEDIPRGNSMLKKKVSKISFHVKLAKHLEQLSLFPSWEIMHVW